MGKTLDCTGLACPEPVLRTRGALEGMDEGILVVRVNSPASRDNVRRFAESQGCSVAVKESGEGVWELEIVKGFTCRVPSGPEPRAETRSTAFLILADGLGPEPELSRVLMRSFLGTVAQTDPKPARILFLNRGVHLTTEGSPVLDVIREIAEAGVEILSCGTCLEYFGKRGALRVGQVANMYDTVETLTGPHKVVTIG